MKRSELDALLKSLRACYAAREWVETVKGTVYDVWKQCSDPAYLFWLCGQIGIEQKVIATAACKCMRLALPYVTVGEEEMRRYIEIAEAHLRDEATIEQMQKAGCDIYDTTDNDVLTMRIVNAIAYTLDAVVYVMDITPYAITPYAIYTVEELIITVHNSADVEAREMMKQDCCNAIRQVIPFAALLRAAKIKFSELESEAAGRK